jgi:putative membrane protein
MRFVIWLLTTAAGVAAAAWLLDGISFTGPGSGSAELQDKVVPLLLVALILGVVSSIVKPIVTLLSLPLIVLTIGLFLFVINALMLMLTGWIAEQVDLGFSVDGFWTALLGSVVITLVTWLVDSLVGQGD